MRVFVTGAAGYIGSVVTERLIDQGFDVVAFDSLKNGHRGAVHPKAEFIDGDLLDAAALDAAVTGSKAEAVVHLAAEALIDESIRNPGLFFHVNVTGGVNLLESMRRAGIDKMVFSSTAATYGEPQFTPITEDHPKDPVNAYGESKLQFERVMAWYTRSFGLKHISLRYFNACGATAAYGEHREKETHIIPILLQVVTGEREKFTVFGSDYNTPDGTCVRDYVHVVDIADAHILALGKIHDLEPRAYNLGNGDGYTNLQVVESVRRITGKNIEVMPGARREGDPAVLIASSEKIRQELGWTPKFPELDGMVRSAWEWKQAHPKGYQA
jgi:UDP-glucose 4-epimerase